MLISQFTLYADCKRETVHHLLKLEDLIMQMIYLNISYPTSRNKISIVETGIFAVDMKVSLINDGPFTIVIIQMKSAPKLKVNKYQ